MADGIHPIEKEIHIMEEIFEKLLKLSSSSMEQEKIINYLKGLDITPQTSEENEKLKNDPRIKQKVQIVKQLLRVYGFTLAANEIKITNVKNYAQWILHSAKQRIEIRTEQYNKAREILEKLDLKI